MMSVAGKNLINSDGKCLEAQHPEPLSSRLARPTNPRVAFLEAFSLHLLPRRNE
jgi:hypothetical protein